jgi:hypothetical protein
MKRVLVIDDVKEFTFPADCSVDYARTLDDGVLLLRAILQTSLINASAEFELWLDHDLGGDDTIRPLVLALAESAFYGDIYPIDRVVICSANPVGVKWIQSTLERYYSVVCYDWSKGSHQ